jgi:hypothetical protein
MQITSIYLFAAWNRLMMISLVPLIVCGSVTGLSAQSLAPTTATGTSATPVDTNVVPSIPQASTVPPVQQMQEITVVGQLDQARQQIVPSLGATVYTIDQQDIQDLSQGENIPFSKLLLRFPGVSQDSAASGSFHVRTRTCSTASTTC